MPKDAEERDEAPEGADFRVKKPPFIAVSDLVKLLDKRFAVLATADQLSKMSGRINRNEEEITKIKGEIRQINQKLSNRTEQIQIAERPKTTANEFNMGPGRELSYWTSRRSVRVWPIDGETEDQMRKNFAEFQRDALKISPRDTDSMIVDIMRRTRSSPNANAYKEVCVTFSEIDERDFVASRAINLSGYINSEGQPQAGIRLDVPGFLLPTYRDLNGYAYPHYFLSLIHI